MYDVNKRDLSRLWASFSCDMSTPKELQEEEYEVLKSIYEGDEKFTEISQTAFTYKFESGEDLGQRSFAVEFSLTENYPEELPGINLELFYNSSLNRESKNNLKSFLLDQAAPLLGSAMIYTLIEALKENVDQLIIIKDTPNEVVEENPRTVETSLSKKAEKKEQLTKAQKRRILNRQEKGEYPRGWNWVDIIHHLSSTSQKNS